MSTQILVGHVITKLRELPEKSVHVVWTSPPYYGLRSYGTEPQVWGGSETCKHKWGSKVVLPLPAGAQGATSERTDRANVDAQKARRERGNFCSKCGAWRGEHGLEPSFGMWLDNEVLIFREVRRVLRDDGVLFLNIGDAYATQPNGLKAAVQKAIGNDDRTFRDKPVTTIGPIYQEDHRPSGQSGRRGRSGNLGNGGINGKDLPDGRVVAAGHFKNKDRLMMPARLAIALHADGWWLRDEVVLHKLNPMPSSIKDRTCPAHEMLYMFTKKERYFYDWLAVAEPFADGRMGRDYKTPDGWDTGEGAHGSIHRAGREKGKKASELRGRDTYGRHTMGEALPEEQRRTSERPVGERNRGGRTDGFTKPNNIDPSANGGRLKRSVWSQALEPFPEAHFATAPTGWVRPCVLAGSSSKGVCPTCGAPWRRVIETTYEERADCRPGKMREEHQYAEDNGWVGYPDVHANRKTSGWEIGCNCAPLPPVPATVLDPFGGAGTTALVAEELGRNAILIELNPEYAQMARARIREHMGRVTSELPDDKPADLPLFQQKAAAE